MKDQAFIQAIAEQLNAINSNEYTVSDVFSVDNKIYSINEISNSYDK